MSWLHPRISENPGQAKIFTSFLCGPNANNPLTAAVRGADGCVHRGLHMLGTHVQFGEKDKNSQLTTQRNLWDELQGVGRVCGAGLDFGSSFVEGPFQTTSFWLSGQREKWARQTANSQP